MAVNVSVTFPLVAGRTTLCTPSFEGYEHSKSASTSYTEYSEYARCVIDGIEVGYNSILIKDVTTVDSTYTTRYTAFFRNGILTLFTGVTVISESTTPMLIPARTAPEYTTVATFYRDLEGYYNADEIKVPDNWITNALYSQPFSDARHTFTNYLDQDGNPLVGYSAATFSADFPRVADDSATLDMYDEGVQLQCLKKGCVPLFTARKLQSNISGEPLYRDVGPANGKAGARIGFSTPQSGNPEWVPFHSVTSGTDILMYRTDDELVIGDMTYGPGDFRDGVIPEYVYALVYGAGGGGAGTPGGSGTGAAGGGSGSLVGGIINLKDSWELHLTVGTGGAGGTKSSNPDSQGGLTRLTISAKIRYGLTDTYLDSESDARMIAYGGKGGSGAGASRTGGSGGSLPSVVTRATATGLDDREYQSPYLILVTTPAQGTAGNAGTATGSNGVIPSAFGGPAAKLITSMAYNTYLTSGSEYADWICYHSAIQPLTYLGGSDGSTQSNSAGGGAGSLLGRGGNGKVQAAGNAGGRGAGGGGAGGQLIGGGWSGGAGGNGAILFFY